MATRMQSGPTTLTRTSSKRQQISYDKMVNDTSKLNGSKHIGNFRKLQEPWIFGKYSTTAELTIGLATASNRVFPLKLLRPEMYWDKTHRMISHFERQPHVFSVLSWMSSEKMVIFFKMLIGVPLQQCSGGLTCSTTGDSHSKCVPKCVYSRLWLFYIRMLLFYIWN